MSLEQTLRFNFSMPVWGTRYVDILINMGLPSQLTKGNLLGFPWLSQSLYEIYTTKLDQKLIVESSVFKLLERTLETRFVYIDHVMSDNKWRVLRHCNRESVKSADCRNAALFSLSPDLIWTENSFTNAANHIAKGYSAVLCPGLRTTFETAVPLLRQKYLSNDKRSMGVPVRDLVKICIENIHPEMKIWFWDSPNYYKFPTYILFDVPGEGISAFCYILHPVVINAQIRNAPFRLIFDQDYLEAACPDVRKIYIAQDSDELIFIELSPKNAPIPPQPEPQLPPIQAMTWYGEWQYNRQHRQFVKNPVRIHYTNLSSKKWKQIEGRGFHIIEQIEAGWNIPDRILLESNPKNLLRRIEARYRFNPEEISTEDRELKEGAQAIIEATTLKTAVIQITALERIKNTIRRFPKLVRVLKLLRNMLLTHRI